MAFEMKVRRFQAEYEGLILKIVLGMFIEEEKVTEEMWMEIRRFCKDGIIILASYEPEPDAC